MEHRTTTSASASSSSAPYSASTHFQVFINHRGRDVKKTFAAHLYRSLSDHHGLQVFLDERELLPGNEIDFQIKEAIQVASVHIAIFSKNYSKSNWCLDELCLMIDAEKRGATILPVFYNVKPSELQWTGPGKDGPYAKALRKHEEKQRYHSRRIKSWRKALSHVAKISGFELEACNGNEEKLLEKVELGVLTKLPKPALHVAKYATGLGEKIEDFQKTILFQQEKQPVEAKVVGIAGLGGIGKTTLATEFFNCKRSHYARSSFLADVRAKASRSSLPSLQSKLIKDLKGDKIDREIERWEEGIGILKTCLSSCHALIILDDVDDADQLDAFLPIKGVLDPKSLILVTSRDKHVLRSAGIAKSSIYELKGLNKQHSQELFCSHAFFKPYPRPGFENLVDRFVKDCDGLPLSLKVFGALLCEKDESYWEEKLNQLKKLPCKTLPCKILERLKISYNSLDQKEQQIFLDIACFAIGQERDKWVRIWGGSTGLQTLQDRCLVEMDSWKSMRMHDHLRDMGRDIAEEVSMPRRLWRSIKDVHDLFEEQSSSVMPEVRGIRMPCRWSSLTEEEELLRSKSEIPLNKISTQPASKMRKLQLLESEGEFVEGILRRVRSPNLVWLRWSDCPCSSLPSWIPIDHLKVLEVEGRELKKLWHCDSQAPLQLRELYVNAPLLEFPKSIEKLRYLEKIVLVGKTANLSTLPEEFFHVRSLKYLKLAGCFGILPNDLRNFTNLQHLDLFGCERWEKLPDSFTDLTNLQHLELSGCDRLKRLPKSFGDLTNLQQIILYGCNSLKKLPKSLGGLTNLQRITMNKCESLEVLSDSFGNLTNVLQIELSGCKRLKKLPDSFADLTNLRHICLSGCKSLKKLPNSLGDLTNLQRITMSECESLEVLPDSFGNLTNLQQINLSGCNRLKWLPNSLGNLTNVLQIKLYGCKRLKKLPDSFTDLTNLQDLKMSGSDRLKRLPKSLGYLTNLQHIGLSECKSLKKLPNSLGYLTNLQRINLGGCESLEVLPDSFGNLTNLQQIDLFGCNRLKRLPNSLGDSTNLQRITLVACKSLEVLPDSFGNLTNLQHITLSGCERLEVLPDSFGNLTNLQHITLRECERLEILPDSFGNLTNLLHISLSGLKRLKKLPDFFTDLTNLQDLQLSGSDRLKRLPKSLGYLTNLQHIRLSGCKSLKKLPNSLGNLTNLRRISLPECESLEVLPDTFGNLANLQEIWLSGCNRLKRLPNSMGDLTNLQRITLLKCESLEVLPDSFGNLKNLKSIHLQASSLNTLPNSFWHLTNLENIILPYCESLEKLPDSLGNLTNLRRIYLCGCTSLKKLPKSLGELTNLRSIDLSGCKSLKKLPNSLGKLLQLKLLYLSHCCMSLPTTLGNITTLQVLDFSGCVQMEVLPAQVEHQKSMKMLNLLGTNLKELTNAHAVCLRNLTYLFVGSPLLKELPPSLGCLSSLKILLLHGCQEMKRLPDSVGLLTQLATLEISKCGIHHLPGLMEMNNLQTLRVRGCPLRELPFKVESALRKRKRRAKDKGLIGLKVLELYCTEISEVSFPEGVCIDLQTLRIRCCNDLVKVGSLPATLGHLILTGCGALKKIEGLFGLAKPLEVDIRGCYNIQVEELTHFGNVKLLFTPGDAYNRQEEEIVEKEMAALQEGVLPSRFSKTHIKRLLNLYEEIMYEEIM